MTISNVEIAGGDLIHDQQRSQIAFEQALTTAGQIAGNEHKELMNERIESAESVLEGKVERAEKWAQTLEDRLEAARKDPTVDELRLEILELRTTIADERAEFLNGGLDDLNELKNIYASDEPVDDVAILENELENITEAEAYFLQRADNLRTLASLVAEKGNQGWSEKFLTRADKATEMAEQASEGIEHYSEAIDEIRGEALPEVGTPVTNDELLLIQGALAETDLFGESQVSSARNLTSGELAGMREIAIDLGADEADLEFFDFITETVPIQIVFVDGLVEDLGVFGATGGEASIPTGIGILLDSTFVDSNFDDGLSGLNSVSAHGAEVFIHEATHVLQDFEIIDYSGEVGDGDPFPELAAGATVNELDSEDQATFVELSAAEYVEDTAVLG